MPDTATENRIEEIAKTGMHLGYSRRSRNPQMNKFIFGLRNNVEVFDINAIDTQLEKAKAFVSSLGADSKQLLFVGTKQEAKVPITSTAESLNMPSVTVRWLGGTLTNFKQIRSRVDEMKKLREERETGGLEKYTKKEQVRISDKISKLGMLLGGIELLENIPSALVVIDQKIERNAVQEANVKGVPVIALGNSDTDPRGIDYMVPGNDGSQSSIMFFLNELRSAYKNK